MAFYILDPHNLPEKKEDLIQYNNNELQDLGKHYGKQKVNRFEDKVNAQDAAINTTALTAELPLFKSIMFEKCLSYHSIVDRDISRAHMVNVQELIKKRESYTLEKLRMISNTKMLWTRFIPSVFTSFICFWFSLLT